MATSLINASRWGSGRVLMAWAAWCAFGILGLQAWAQGVCDPLTQCCPPGAAAGAACATAGPTTWSAASPVDVGVGNPINLVNGNKHLQEVDMPALPGVLGLELVRHYNSASAGVQGPPGSVGWGWRFSYEATLTASGGGRVVVRQADGTQWAFAAVAPAAAPPGLARLHSGPAGEVWAEPDGAAWRHRWRWTRGPHAGRELRFDTHGRLVQITAATGEWLAIQYDPLGRLAQVTDPQGRSLFFHPVATRAAGGTTPARFVGVGAVDTPMGRYTYRHGVPEGGSGLAARLEGVDLPTHTSPGHALSNRPVTTSATSRRYHHEDPRWPTHLTGISLHGTGSDGVPVDARLSTYAYNPQGRAHLSTADSGDVDGVATGSQVRLAWPQPGWVWLTNAHGAQTVYRTTYLGGHVRVLEARGAGCPSCGPVNRRYRYDAAGRLLAVSALAPVPVAQGRPLPTARPLGETRWVRDGLGRVMRVEQTQVGQHQARVLWQAVYGDPRWPDHPTRVLRPSVRPGLWQHTDWVYNGHGQVLRVVETGHSPLDTTPLVRASVYRYQQVNGRSVLVAVDGPLPNGPLGDSQDSDVTGITWDPQGHAPTGLRRPGRASAEVTYAAGSGLLQSVATPDGVRTDWAYDPLQQPVHTRTQAPGWQTALWHGYQRNASGWVTAWLEQAPGDRAPRATRRAAYDTQGRLLWQAGALGLARVYRYGPDGGLAAVQQHSADMSRAVVAVAGAPHLEPVPASIPQTDLDDWGRPVRTRSADTGVVTRVFDAADRLVAMTDAVGRTARYHWDLQNRLVEQAIAAQAEAPVTTRWRYQGDRLVALEHPDQSERYQHDPRGLRRLRTVALPGASALGVVTVHSQYRHDAAGRLASVRLPSGAWLRYQRNGQGQVVAVHLNPVHTPWLQSWAREQVVVQGLARDLVGLRRLVAGNGIETLHQRSPQAGLARVVHRRVLAPVAASTAWGWSSAHASTPDPVPPPANHSQPPGALGWPADPQALWDQRYLWDNAGNLVHQQQKAGDPAWSTHAYDGANRWVASVEWPPAEGSEQPTLWRQAYTEDDRRVLDQTTTKGPWDLDTGTRHHRFQPGTHRLLGAPATRTYGADGLPNTWGDKTLRWDALGRLVAVDRADVPVARYRYDHRGLRHTQTTAQGTTHSVYSEDRSLLAELNAQGHITRQYIQLAGLPLALWDSPEGLPPATVDREPLDQLWSDLLAVWRSWWGGPVPLTWVHLNHLEAPVLATNAQGHVVWRAHHRPNGVAEVTQADMPIHLRGPGQHADAATGWVYNRQRYLDPALGQYLSPDPLGTPDGPNPYTHVGHNPLRYVDPDGLVLFSFDGTHNSLASQTNVQLFARHYADYSAYDQAAQIDWRRYYIPGPGTNAEDWLDGQVVGGLVAPRLRSIVNTQVDLWIDYVQKRTLWEVQSAAKTGRVYTPSQPLDIHLDVVGFSRGAAAAREFLNRVDDLSRQGFYRQTTGGVCVRIVPRFAGLFDTVLSANTDFNMRMGIPESVQYVAHAVAVNEHRALFPLESIEDRYGAPGSDANRVERGFLGAHGDIGGGYTVKDGSDFSDVALQWMWQQAVAQGVRMDNLAAPLQVVSHPVVHDERRAVLWRVLLQMQPTPELADRRVLYRAAPDRPVPDVWQREAPTVGLDHQGSLGLLTFRNLGLADQFNTQVADVNLTAYRAWLAQHHAWRP